MLVVTPFISNIHPYTHSIVSICRYLQGIIYLTYINEFIIFFFFKWLDKKRQYLLFLLFIIFLYFIIFIYMSANFNRFLVPNNKSNNWLHNKLFDIHIYTDIYNSFHNFYQIMDEKVKIDQFIFRLLIFLIIFIFAFIYSV